MEEKKPRMTEVRVAFDGPMTLSGMSPPGEPLRFYGPNGEVVVPELIEIGRAYERDNGKGPKVMTRALADPKAIEPDVNKLIARFGSVLAVDTNTREISGRRVSVTVAFWLMDIVVTGETWSARAAPQVALEFHDARESPEHIGWAHAITMIAASPIPRPVALFVDSDLDALSAINKRERPYFGDALLPPDITLLYASSDTGRSELVGNKALGMCDADAGHILRRVAAAPMDDSVYDLVTPYPCERARVWTPPQTVPPQPPQNGTSSSG